ncbi:TMP-TENI-domain-containing protein [Gaertneriomyces semiglobifer]|nr:TMP-TENI-domain-containing protein [Gaertneriomyces semiglobifer]
MAGHSKAFDLSLYLVTDQRLLPAGVDLVTAVAAAIDGGVTLVQLREKSLDTKTFVATAQQILLVCRARNVPLLINDRLDVAIAVGADGVHIGQGDMPLSTARAMLGPDKIIGITVETVQQALDAVAGGADYIGTAAIFPTGTKPHAADFDFLGFEGVQRILRAVRKFHIPVCTIGGINLGNVDDVFTKTIVAGDHEGQETRLSGVAVVSAIIAQDDVKAAAAALAGRIGVYTRSGHSGSAVARTPLTSDANRHVVEQVAAAFVRLKERKPLIHNITNYVVMNDTANTILQLGGLPVMAHSVDEVADITAVSQALVLNIGTLSSQWVDGMMVAGKKANEVSIPVVLDPVGAGATPFRKSTCVSLIQDLQISIIKGNAGEIAAIAGLEGVKMRGVESVGDLNNPAEVTQSLAAKVKSCIAMSGPIDYISDGKRTVCIRNGNEWLGKLTGTGCSTTSLIACFAAVEEDPLIAAIGGLVCMGLAAEHAAACHTVNGPGTFKVALHDALYNLTAEKIRFGARLAVC